MDRTRFWPENQSADCRPLTPAGITRAERILDCHLPDAYLALLHARNGGETRGFVFPTTQRISWAADHVPFESLNGIEENDGRKERGILSDSKTCATWGVPDRLVPLCGDGHWWIALDYRRGAEPSVTWYDTEVEEDIPLAPSFDAFLSGLRPAEEVDEEECILRVNRGKWKTPEEADEPQIGPGADWLCPSCRESVPGTFGSCWNCGQMYPGHGAGR